jgi:hypothetical protein
VSAIWIGAFARPLGVALFSAILIVGYAYHQRAVYRAGHLPLVETSGRTREVSP